MTAHPVLLEATLRHQASARREMLPSALLERVASPIAGPDEITFGRTRHPDLALPDRPHILNIAPVAGDPEQLVREALARDLSRVNRVRFDPVNACNLRCAFCATSQTERYATIAPASFAEVLQRVARTCRRIIVGCSHEPLMSREFAEHGLAIGRVIDTHFATRPVVSLTTNGTLLHLRSLAAWDFLSWLWISVASHRQETIERIEGCAADIGQIEANIRLVRAQHSALRIHLEFVANALNQQDAAGFVAWAFGLGVTSVNVRRVGAEPIYMAGSYLAESFDKGVALGLSDGEWADIVGAVTASHPAQLARCTIAANTGAGAVQSPVLELTAGAWSMPDE